MADFNIVTSAGGFTGRYITKLLLARGERVSTLTGRPELPTPFGQQVPSQPFNFDRPDELARTLEGASRLFNTYWVRFPQGRSGYDVAVRNSLTLIAAAAKAGVERLIHISVTQADERSPLPYYRGKALVEQALMASGLSYAIVRPTVVFGREDILINNIAWFLRRFPVFAVPGSGRYRVQPVHVEDVASLAVEAGDQHADLSLDAAGPESLTFDDLLRTLARALGVPARLVHLPAPAVHTLLQGANLLVRDVVLTREEIAGLMAGLLVSRDPPRGRVRLSEWAAENAGALGRRYASELDRHYRGRRS